MQKFETSIEESELTALRVVSFRMTEKENLEDNLGCDVRFFDKNDLKPSFDGDEYAAHFDLDLIRVYIGDDKTAMAEMIFVIKNELMQHSNQLETKLINNDMFGFKDTGIRIYETAVSLGLPGLSQITYEFLYLNNFNVDYVDALFVKTKQEIDLLI